MGVAGLMTRWEEGDLFSKKARPDYHKNILMLSARFLLFSKNQNI